MPQRAHAASARADRRGDADVHARAGRGDRHLRARIGDGRARVRASVSIRSSFGYENYADDDPDDGQALVEQVAPRVLPERRRGVRLVAPTAAAAVDARWPLSRRARAWRRRPIPRASGRRRRDRADSRPTASRVVQAGTQDIGTGTYTIMTQIAARCPRLAARTTCASSSATRRFRRRQCPAGRRRRRARAPAVKHRLPRVAFAARRAGDRRRGVTAPRSRRRRTSTSTTARWSPRADRSKRDAYADVVATFEAARNRTASAHQDEGGSQGRTRPTPSARSSSR